MRMSVRAMPGFMIHKTTSIFIPHVYLRVVRHLHATANLYWHFKWQKIDS